MTTYQLHSIIYWNFVVKGFFNETDKLLKPLTKIIGSKKQAFNFDLETNYLGIILLVPRLVCLIVVTFTVYILKSEIVFKAEKSCGASELFQQLIKDKIIVETFGMTCFNSFVTVIGSQLLLKNFLENFDLRIFSYTPHFGLGFTLDVACEMCFLSSYLAMKNSYIFQ